MQLEVWKKARRVTIAVFELTRRFPQSQLFGLTSQLQRASISIGSNIAEGYGRWTGKDKAHFYVISKGSAEEVMHLLVLSADVGFHPGAPELLQTLDEICAMLTRLAQKSLTGFWEDY